MSNPPTNHLLFTDEEMTSDPVPKAPTIILKETDANEPLPPEEKRADAWFNSNKVPRVPVIALEQDVFKIPGQNFACFSVIRPEDYGVLHHGDSSYKGFLIKFRGVFPSREEADKHIRKVMGTDRNFDVHLVPCFQWSRMDDDTPEDREHLNSTIGDIMKGYFKEENNRMKGLRERIANTEEGKVVRADEANDFFDKAVNAHPTALPACPSDVRPLSLEELAKGYDINPRGSTILSTPMDTIEEEKIKAVISEVLLDEEDGADSACAKASPTSLEE